MQFEYERFDMTDQFGRTSRTDRVVDCQREIGVAWVARHQEGKIEFELSIRNDVFILRVQETVDREKNKLVWRVENTQFPEEYTGDRKSVQSIALEGLQEYVRIARAMSRIRIEVELGIK